MLDATDVQSETDLGQATEPQVTNWDAALDGPEEQPTEQAEANAEQSPADTADAAGDNAEPAEDRPAGESLESAEDYIKRIRRAREVVRHTAADWESAKEEAKDAKKAWEKAVEDLTVVIDRGRERYPLFEHLEQEQAAGDLEQPAEEAEEGTEDTSWRTVPLESIGVSAGTCAILADNPERPIKTIGDVADWTTQQVDHSDPLLLIPKIGKAKRDQIIECCDKFWEERSQESHGETDN